jgi:hypothetical protein
LQILRLIKLSLNYGILGMLGLGCVCNSVANNRTLCNTVANSMQRQMLCNTVANRALYSVFYVILLYGVFYLILLHRIRSELHLRRICFCMLLRRICLWTRRRVVHLEIEHASNLLARARCLCLSEMEHACNLHWLLLLLRQHQPLSPNACRVLVHRCSLRDPTRSRHSMGGSGGRWVGGRGGGGGSGRLVLGCVSTRLCCCAARQELHTFS